MSLFHNLLTLSLCLSFCFSLCSCLCVVVSLCLCLSQCVLLCVYLSMLLSLPCSMSLPSSAPPILSPATGSGRLLTTVARLGAAQTGPRAPLAWPGWVGLDWGPASGPRQPLPVSLSHFLYLPSLLASLCLALTRPLFVSGPLRSSPTPLALHIPWAAGGSWGGR